MSNETWFLIIAAFVILLILLLIFRSVKKIGRITAEEGELLKNRQNFSAEVKKNMILTKNTEMIDLEVKIPDGCKWILEVVNDVDGSERRINSARFGDKGSRITFKVRKGDDMTFVITGKGKYGSKMIKIPYSS